MQYGMSVEQYVRQVRLERARELLARGASVTDAAFAVEMESSSAFATFFKKEAGVAPSEFAEQWAVERPFCFCETPAGRLRIAEDEQGIISICFVDEAAFEPRGKGVYLPEAKAQLEAYFAGKRPAFDVPLSLRGSRFQMEVWAALREIPYGETRSYQEVAAAVGNAKAARAVGTANHRNPVLIMVPCHRVVGKDGKLVGYAGGLERKRYLLEMEAGRR